MTPGVCMAPIYCTSGFAPADPIGSFDRCNRALGIVRLALPFAPAPSTLLLAFPRTFYCLLETPLFFHSPAHRAARLEGCDSGT